MHKSFFTYNLVKPYPYRWFTWLVIVGGIAATAIFSLINLAATGYELSNVYVNTPNNTESPEDLKWFQKKPWSWSEKVVSNCQSQTLSIGMRGRLSILPLYLADMPTEIYTTNSALLYTVADLYRGRLTNGTRKGTYSIAYHDGYLDDCVIKSLDMSPAEDLSLTLKLDARIECLLYEDSLPVTLFLELQATVDSFGIISSTMGGRPFDYSTIVDKTSSLAVAWRSTYTCSHSISPARDEKVLYTLQPYGTENVTEFLVSIGIWATDDTDAANATEFEYHMSPTDWISTFADELSIKNHVLISKSGKYFIINQTGSATQKMLIIDGLAKSIWSLILTDLGQSTNMNIFAGPNSTMHFLEKTYQLFNNRSSVSNSSAYHNLSTQQINSTNWSKTLINGSSFDVAPARIAQQYVCQVPKLKSTSSLVVGIITADLVFLQALWTIVNWIALFFVQRQDPGAHHCERCIKTLDPQEVNVTEPESESLMIESPRSSSSRRSPSPNQSLDMTNTYVESGAVSVRSNPSVSSSMILRRRHDAEAGPPLLSP